MKLWIWVLCVFCLCYVSRCFDPPVSYLINCGSSNDTLVGTRTYISDKSSTKYLSTIENILASNNINSITPDDDSTLYNTARVFTKISNYKFSITHSGRIWIRLYFYPFTYQTFDMNSALFSVSTQKNTLLGDFNPLKNITTVKEFSINVTSGDFIITFSPTNNSFAFINALEIVSSPDNLIPDGANYVTHSGSYKGLPEQAMETIYRINMGGPLVTFKNDTLWRTWISDTNFLVSSNLAKNVSKIESVTYPDGGATQEIAPPTVYGTCVRMNSDNDPNSNFNVTWKFNVDPGFEYLIRFHFCDIVSVTANQLLFNVYIDSNIILRDFELSSKVFGNLATAFYIDFVRDLSDRDILSVSIGPSLISSYPNAILNGLEIMKINNTFGSFTKVLSIPSQINSNSKNNIGVILGTSLGVLFALIILGVLFYVFRGEKRKKHEQLGNSKTWVPLCNSNSNTIGSKSSNNTTISLDSNLSYRIPFSILNEATNKFDETLIIGIGGFGKVYKGVFTDGTKVAVKRGNPKSQQGLSEFRTEIEMLSQFRHRHLVSLIGYCDENNEMILVYEYMENGTVKSHLYGSDLPSLSWKKRLEICIGAARGLHYLHTGYAIAVIHRDVKSANILLDENYLAKVADFGLSKTGPELDQTHVSTAVKGSFGYLDPEYFRRQQLTEKSDVYSFGVVLFEVLCARPVIDPSRSREMVNLAEWAMKWQKKGQISRIIDTNLVGKVKENSLRKFAETAEKCLAEYGVERPSMGDVLWNLEYALQLQEAVIQNDPEENSSNLIGEISPQISDFSQFNASDSGGQVELVSLGDISDVSMSRVFSQLVKSEGR